MEEEEEKKLGETWADVEAAQDAAHSFDETPKWVTDYNANRQAVNVLEAELTRLRSELQQAKQEIAMLRDSLKVKKPTKDF